MPSKQISNHVKPARFLDPKSDIVFKKIFGQHPHLAKSFLNGVLPIESPIEEIEYLPAEQTPSIPVLKNTIVDVKCKDEKGRIFIVEMQLQWTTHFMKRLLFGASKAYVQQLEKKEDYSGLCPVYGLAILDAIFDRKTLEWFHHYRTVNVKQPEQVLEGLELIFVELPKFTAQTWNDPKLGVLWLRFLKELNETFTDVPQEFFDQPEIYEAMALAQESAYSLRNRYISEAVDSLSFMVAMSLRMSSQWTKASSVLMYLSFVMIQFLRSRSRLDLNAYRLCRFTPLILGAYEIPKIWVTAKITSE